jgi:FkbM family methyltransferase
MRFHKIGRHSILLPDDHALPRYQAQWPRYDTALGRIANLAKQKYQDLYAIDVGANIGDTAALIQSKHTIPTLCIEGTPAYVTILRQNAEIIGNVVVESVFVGNLSSDEKRQGIIVQNGTARIVQTEPHKDSLEIENSSLLQFLTLEQILEKNASFCSSKLLKIDTDGFDFQILLGSVSFLKRVLPIIYFEYDISFNHEDLSRSIICLRTLFQNGYKYFVVYDNFGNYILSITTEEIDTFLDLNAYLVSSKTLNGKPAIYYFDICAYHKEDFDVFCSLVEQERAIGKIKDENNISSQTFF